MRPGWGSIPPQNPTEPSTMQIFWWWEAGQTSLVPDAVEKSFDTGS